MAFSNLALLLALSCFSFAIPFNSRPFENALRQRRPSLGPRATDEVLYTNSSSELQVDLGYEIYQGLYNSTIGLNTWLGIRYAAPPIGALRWQAPQVPTSNRSSVIQAQTVPNQCPQSADNSGNLTAAVLGSSTAGGSEDCLFLNVYAPQNAQNLPVLVWIHGGGYGQGNGNLNFTPIIKGNNDGFIGVAIQYRLGAFGFLSSDEVNRFGVPNAGIRDQTFALQWVQSYISLFGGNASQVTISGESAGGGSVMLQTMAFGGNLGTSLFSNAITASPYLPMQYNYNDWVPSQSYYAFAQAAGCFSGYAEGSLAIGSSIFQCLVATDTETLKNASAAISASGSWGTWGFLPVTDGSFIQDIPSQQLMKKQVNGVRMLTGNNADEGAEFVPGNITTEADLVNYLQETFPLFTEDDISKILLYYPSSNATDDPNAALYATTGESGPTAINQSSVATGQQQRADSIYGETTFVCPSYWLAEAFTSKDRASYKYQYSIPPALHGADASAYFGPAQDTQSPSFVRAFMTIWGNFIISNNPSISSSIARGNASSDAGDGGIVNWPTYNNLSPMMVNLNQTGGVPESADSGIVDLDTGNPINTTIYVEPGLQNKFDVVDAWSWEGGRGVRCDFWKSMGVLVPE